MRVFKGGCVGRDNGTDRDVESHAVGGSPPNKSLPVSMSVPGL